MTQAYDINAIIAQAAQESVDLTEASVGGSFDNTPVAGTCIATLIGYIELGRRLKKGWQGAPDKKMLQAKFIFELAGGQNKPVETDTGAKIPKRITIKTWLPEPGRQPSDKSGFYKLLSAMNHAKDPSIKIPAQLIGQHFKVIVSVEEFDGDNGKVKYGSIGNGKDGFRIFAPVVDIIDPESGVPTGETRVMAKPERISDIRVFLWQYANKAMWDALFIEGEYEAVEAKDGKPARPAKSKNVIQLELAEALDWAGSPIQQILTAGGELDVAGLEDKTEAPTVAADEADPLAGMV